MNAQKLKVLRISHSGNVHAYRARERQLVADFPVEVRLVLPQEWEHLGGSDQGYESAFVTRRCRTIGTGSIPLFAYDPVLLINEIRDFKPDIIDVHEEPYSVSCFESFLLAEAFAPTAARVFYSAQNIWKSYPPPFSMTEKYVYAKSHGAYPCSLGVKEVLNRKGYKKNDGVIPLGFDPTVFHPKKKDFSKFALEDSNKTIIGYFGRLEESKGLQTVLDALGSLHSDQSWSLIVGGSGSYQSKLQELASKLGIAERVRWLGPVAGSDMPDAISLCDICVVPSLTTKTWKEQFGRAVVEAMACGAVAITSDSGSLPEVTAHAGLIAKEGDIASWSAALETLISNRDLTEHYKQAGLKYASENYTWKKVADLSYTFYEDALKLRRTQRF